MRYAQGGGLTHVHRGNRGRLRLQTVERFEAGQRNGEVAAALRVSERSVERWRRAWCECGRAGVLSKGSPGRSRLSEGQIARLERELERGPPAHGWADQRGTPTSSRRRASGRWSKARSATSAPRTSLKSPEP
ncbi:helix-turn-helix domain-containing protein [Streptomyces cocklensis]|nr:helix-turn-helix domain-containing protein [Actinacidiphila cocklensis]MDD1062631.1 helix-turn-helix domain-containing protein [Actinacidiphila cocklensis]